MIVPAEVVAAALGGVFSGGAILARVWQRTEQTYQILTGADEREDDQGLIGQVEETAELAQKNREALRKEGIRQ